MQPGAYSFKWVKLWVVGKNYSASPEPARLAHNWSPVTKEALKIAPARSIPSEYITGNIFLRYYGAGRSCCLCVDGNLDIAIHNFVDQTHLVSLQPVNKPLNLIVRKIL
jgi:hypothetical protein